MDPIEEDGAGGGRKPPPPPTPLAPHSGSATSGDTSAQGSKRKRGLGVVTPNACTECRKKRAKVGWSVTWSPILPLAAKS